MTHEELLAKIKTGNEFIGVKYAPDSHTFALRAVIELHKPHELDGASCRGCGTPYYPCETIKAIEKELK